MSKLTSFLSLTPVEEVLYGQALKDPKPKNIRGVRYVPFLKLHYVSPHILKHYEDAYGLTQDDVYQLFEDIDDFRLVRIHARIQKHVVFQTTYTVKEETPMVCFRIAFNRLHPRECPLLADENHVYLSYVDWDGNTVDVTIGYLKEVHAKPAPMYRSTTEERLCER